MENFLQRSQPLDKSLLWLLGAGIIGSAAIIIAIAVYIASTKIIVRPIADVNVLQSAPSNSEPRPISDLLDGVNRGDRKTVWFGYAANLKDLCAAGDISNKKLKPSIVLIRAAETTSASTVQLRPTICEKLRSAGSTSAIYVAADHPFQNVPSEKQWITVDKYQK